MKELDKYKTIKKLVEIGGNKTRAAISIGCSKRYINRMIQGYKEQGKEFGCVANTPQISTKFPNPQTYVFEILFLGNIKKLVDQSNFFSHICLL